MQPAGVRPGPLPSVRMSRVECEMCEVPTPAVRSADAQAEGGSLSSDQPIQVRGEDRLGRLPFVELLAEEILDSPTADGFVMALTAPWGEGKTSVLNLVADSVQDEVVVVRFNPWLFTDAQALVIRFFSELSAQVRRNQALRRVGKRMLAYGQAVAPVGSLLVGPAAGLVSQTVNAVAATEPRGIDEQRQRLKDELNERKQRILVLVDDIDRLHDREILDVMRLVKLVGDLPFITYLLAFDRPYVEKALGREQFDGRSYLEKVVQVTYDLPAIRPAELQELLWTSLDSVLAPLEFLPIRKERWSEVFSRAIAPFFSNLRDVARYVSGVSVRVRLIGREVALEDILALETLRVFEPAVHQELPVLVSALTKERSGLFFSEKDEEEKDRALLEGAIARATPARTAKVKALLATLFPRAGEALGGPAYRSEGWRASRQVADPSALRAYLHATLDPGAASQTLVLEVIAALGDQDEIRGLLDGVDASVLEDLLHRLPGLEGRIDPGTAPVGAAELLRLRARLSDERADLRPSPQFYVKRAVLAILRTVADDTKRQEILEEIYGTAESDSDRWWLLRWFGTYPDRERRSAEVELLDSEATTRLETDLRERVRSKGPKEILDEDSLSQLVWCGYADDEERALEEVAGDALMLALLRSLTGFSIDSNEPYFNLARAERLFGRAFLIGRVEQLRRAEALTAKDRSVLDLAEGAFKSEAVADQGGSDDGSGPVDEE